MTKISRLKIAERAPTGVVASQNTSSSVVSLKDQQVYLERLRTDLMESSKVFADRRNGARCGIETALASLESDASLSEETRRQLVGLFEDLSVNLKALDEVIPRMSEKALSMLDSVETNKKRSIGSSGQ
jgi:hypothetical protein